MKRKRNILILVMVIIVVIRNQHVNADFVFSTAENLGPEINSSLHETSACTSADGLSLVFWRAASFDESGGWWMSERTTKDVPWNNPVDYGPWTASHLNIIGLDDVLSFTTSNGLEVYMTNLEAGRAAEYGGTDLYVWKREKKDDEWGQGVNLGPVVNSAYDERWPSISSDGLELYFCSKRPGGVGKLDIWMTKRARIDAPWTEPVNLGTIVNSPAHDDGTCLSADGLALFFYSTRGGTYGGRDLYLTRRSSRSDPWGEAVNLGPIVNSSAHDEIAYISADGSTLYFGSDRSGGLGGFDIWKVSILPVVDLNSDGIVDAADMCILVDHWGTDDSLCDIGPMPWGDGFVDVQDLFVLAEHLFEETTPVE